MRKIQWDRPAAGNTDTDEDNSHRRHGDGMTRVLFDGQAPETVDYSDPSLLAAETYDCVVIGGGMRLPPKGVVLFENVVNAIHMAAPRAAIAFNTRPEDTAEAAARWVKAD
jgi:hypothetical protein